MYRFTVRAARLFFNNVPLLQQISTELLDTVFVPRVVAKQLLLAMALESGILTYKQVKNVLQNLLSNFSSRNRLIAQLKRRQEATDSMDDWMTIAEAIDLAQGHTVWRSDPDCALYEKERIVRLIYSLSRFLYRWFNQILTLVFTSCYADCSH